MRRVLIESPFAAKTPELLERNRRYVAACMRDSFDRGEAPFASHAIYTLPGVLRDEDPRERELGIRAGLLWGASASLSALYIDLGVSAGMLIGIHQAIACGRELAVRVLGTERLVEVLGGDAVRALEREREAEPGRFDVGLVWSAIRKAEQEREMRKAGA